MDPKLILNIGGGPTRQLPSHYAGWDQHLLDIDPNANPDILCDALDLSVLDTYDAVYTSHTLEHFYKHDLPKVMKNIYNCLKRDGVVEIYVPDIKELVSRLAHSSLDIHDVYYRLSDGSPVTYHDVLYGWNIAMSKGNLYYAHRCGFTGLSLAASLQEAGFDEILVSSDGANIKGLATKKS
jgi:SAM-dependent methyltransferase